MKCKKCGFENLFGTKYCQRCGEVVKVKKRFWNSKNTKYAAGAGQKGVSLAPLGAMAIEEQAKELGPVTTHKNLVKVCPMVDGTWYCPDCGELNRKDSNFCKGCGRDYI